MRSRVGKTGREVELIAHYERVVTTLKAMLSELGWNRRDGSGRMASSTLQPGFERLSRCMGTPPNIGARPLIRRIPMNMPD